MPGPLAGIRVIEVGGIGPGPFACMLMADQGAEVIRVDRPGAGTVGVLADPENDLLLRSRKSLIVDLKRPDGVTVVRDLCRSADILIEGYRPGVMERLGIGPEVLLADNPRLVYGRVTGWGQSGPAAMAAGHDLTYIAVTGNLHSYGRAGDKPTPPINAVGDFGGGGMLTAFGTLAALLHVRSTGKGQVVDCAMTDGAALLATMIWGMFSEGSWRDQRGVNLLDTGAPYYDTYETRDGRHMAVAPLEPQFYAKFLSLAGLADDPVFGRQDDRRQWPAMRATLTELFKTKTRDAWCSVFAGSDACVVPVLSMEEAPDYAQNRERGVFVTPGGVPQPAPAPRFSVTVADEPRPPRPLGADTASVLSALGYAAARITTLKADGTVV
jgi:alpha-methylacyl-CoA racemase